MQQTVNITVISKAPDDNSNDATYQHFPSQMRCTATASPTQLKRLAAPAEYTKRHIYSV